MIVRDLLKLIFEYIYYIFLVMEDEDKDYIIGMLWVSVVMVGFGKDEMIVM